MHVHAHGHSHDDHGPDATGRRRSAERRGLRRTLFLTALILVAEVVGGYVSNSLALLADAGHMFTDVLAIVLAYLAMGFATRPPTKGTPQYPRAQSRHQ